MYIPELRNADPATARNAFARDADCLDAAQAIAMNRKVINFAADFTKTPGGRFRDEGPKSGEEFREDFLIPALREFEEVSVVLNDVYGFPSSFVDEAFGVLVDKVGVSVVRAKLRLRLSDDPIALREIERSIDDHAKAQA